MRATLTTISIVVGIYAFGAGCRGGSTNLFNWGKQDQVAAETEHDYGYYEEDHYGCEEYYDADSEPYDGEYYSEYDDGDYLAYEPCRHGYWYPHEECEYGD